MGTEKEIPFLMEQLNTANNELKILIARTLADIGSNGLQILQDHPKANQYPLREIIEQIKGEHKS